MLALRKSNKQTRELLRGIGAVPKDRLIHEKTARRTYPTRNTRSEGVKLKSERFF